MSTHQQPGGYLDDNNIQIITSSDDIEQILVESASAAASPQVENTTVNEITPKDYQSSLKQKLYEYALYDKWDKAKHEFPNMVRIPLTATGDTALHVAVSAKSTTFVQELVKHMTPEDLKIPNTDGNTAFCIAAISGYGDYFQIMIGKNENLPVIPGQDGMLPVHLAAFSGHHKIVEDLSSENMLDKMAPKDIERLFFMTISCSMYGVATKLFGKYRDKLAVARDDQEQLTAVSHDDQEQPTAVSNDDQEQLTALHMLARKSSVSKAVDGSRYKIPSIYDVVRELLTLELSMMQLIRDKVFAFCLPGSKAVDNSAQSLTSPLIQSTKDKQENNTEEASSAWDDPLQLFKKLWSQVRQLEYEVSLNLITKPSIVWFDAVKSGNVEAVEWLLDMNPELLMIKDSDNGWNLLQFAILYRQNSIFDFIVKMKTADHMIRAVDKDRNNILHLAARQPQVWLSLSPWIEMQRETKWFQEMEKKVPAELSTMRNSKGETPKDVFYAEREKLLEKVNDGAKDLANSGRVIATLIAGVVFGAALGVPGGDKTNPWFVAFFLANTVALYASYISIIYFLTISASPRYSKAINNIISAGYWSLFIAITSMVIAFVAASFFIFPHTSDGVAITVAGYGIIPIFMFLLLGFKFVDDSAVENVINARLNKLLDFPTAKILLDFPNTKKLLEGLEIDAKSGNRKAHH